MTRTAYIFMDFDGVTHPWGEVEDFRVAGARLRIAQMPMMAVTAWLASGV